MTTKCGGGASSPKPGVSTSVYVDQNYVKSLLPPALAFLYPYLPWMAGLAIGNVPAFCAIDPPNIPSVPSAADFLAFLTNSNVGSAIVVNQFLVDVTTAYLWDQLCQCGAGVTPTATIPPSNPGNLPAVNPPTIPPPTAGPCLLTTSPRYTIVNFNDFANMLPAGVLELNGGDGNDFAPLPAGATSFSCAWDTGVADGSGKLFNITLAFWDASFAFFGVQHATNQITGASGTFTGAIASNYRYYNVTLSAPSVSPYPGTNASGATMTVFCNNSTSSTPAVPCCPPDPVLMGLVTKISGLVELIQREEVPFGYIASTVHVGLSGSATLSVQGLLGAKVEVTTLPSSLGLISSDPLYHFDMGFLTWGTPDGYPQSERLQHIPQLSLPSRAGLFTSLTYDFHPGVIATITELVREP